MKEARIGAKWVGVCEIAIINEIILWLSYEKAWEICELPEALAGQVNIQQASSRDSSSSKLLCWRILWGTALVLGLLVC